MRVNVYLARVKEKELQEVAIKIQSERDREGIREKKDFLAIWAEVEFACRSSLYQ